MKKTFLLLITVCILLAACYRPQSTPAESPSITAGPSSTPTSPKSQGDGEQHSQLRIEKPPIPPTPAPPTPTFTPFPPYPTKKVVFEYYIAGSHSLFDTFYAEPPVIPTIILYDDGQMLVGDGQKVLSASEIKSFLSGLDDLGFFSIESNQKHDPTDKLYDYGNSYQESADGSIHCILVNADKSRHLCVYDPDIQFVIPKMLRILAYLDEYKPTGLTPYYPDRILLSVEPFDPNRYETSAIVTPWNSYFPSLDLWPSKNYVYAKYPSIIYIEGEMAKEICIFLENSRSDVFIQDGKKYIVQVRAVLPHETVFNAYQ